VNEELKEHAAKVFGYLAAGRLREFLSWCADDMYIVSRGSFPEPTTLTKRDIPDWYGSFQAMSPTSLHTTTEVARASSDAAMVCLRHSFSRNGVDFLLEMINLVTFREDGRLITWSSYPLDIPEYARARRTHDLSAYLGLTSGLTSV